MGLWLFIAKHQTLTIEIQGNRGVRLAELVLRRDLIFASILDGHVFYFQSGEVRVAIFIDSQLEKFSNRYYGAQIISRTLLIFFIKNFL